MVYHSATKKYNAICSNMDVPRVYHDKWNKSDIERQKSYITHTYNLKKKVKRTYLQNRNILTDIENKPMVNLEEMEEG